MAPVDPLWRVRGSYFEVCNCEAPCSCRRIGGRAPLGLQLDACQFALSWVIAEGHFGEHRLDGLRVAMAGFFKKDERGPAGRLWRVVLYIDDRATPEQASALTEIYLGRAGGSAFENYAKSIVEIYAVRRAAIELDHTPGQERLKIGEWVEASTERYLNVPETVTCGIPGHDRPGAELVASVMRVDYPPLQWVMTGRCGFASDFEFRAGS